jgi:hypothetical protein
MKKIFLITFIIYLSIIGNIFSQSEQKVIDEKSFNFQDSFHSLGFSVFTGINFAPKLQDNSGEIEPVLFPAFVPEFILQYNYMIKNGFGVSLEVPFGVFQRKSLTLLSNYGASNDVWLFMGGFYIGFTTRLSVFKELNSRICMQGELGLKFHPFYHSADQWYNTKDYYNLSEELFYYEDNSSINFTKVKQKYYAIPDANAAILFFFHSKKKPKQNFLVGININLSFVKRIEVTYDTRFSELGLIHSPYGGFGNYGWNSTALGITIGYRFFGVK